MSRLEDIEKTIENDIARLTAEAKFSAWLDQLEGRLQATGLTPAVGSAVGAVDMSPGRRTTRQAGRRAMGFVAALPAEVISFRRNPRRLKRGGGV
ncbi:MAG TPA: hypothetical protein VFZ16_23075 [Hyphomicrobiaceae bacterium]|nr:hypothetical protein [Hyphomicrobiaceae bacterium]